MKHTTRLPFFVVLPKEPERVERMHAKTALKLMEEGYEVAGPFPGWNQVISWKAGRLIKEHFEMEARERMQREKDRCEFCGGLDGFHMVQCPHFEQMYGEGEKVTP